MQNVDVIIPTYNCIFISDAIKSALNQSYQNINIYIVDDGSTDDTKDTVNGLRLSSPDRIHYYYQRQQGPAAARNTGIKKSDGEYIAFLDADDIWLPHKVEKQLEIFNKNSGVGFVYCDNYFIDKNGKEIIDYVRKVKLIEGDILLDFFMDFFLITSGIMIKRSCLKMIGPFDEDLEVGEDFEFFLRLAKDFSAGVVREKLFLRRVWNESLSKQDYELNRRSDLMTIQDFVSRNKDFRKKNSELIDHRINQLYTNLGYAHSQYNKKIKALKAFIAAEKYKRKTFKLKYIFLCLFPSFLKKVIKRIVHE